MFLRCFHFLESGLLSVTLMFPVTRITVYAFILTLVLPPNDLIPFEQTSLSAPMSLLISIQQQHPRWHLFWWFHHLKVRWTVFRFPFFKTTDVFRKTISLMSLYCFVTCIVCSCSAYFDSSPDVGCGFCAPLLLLCISTFVALWGFFISVLSRRWLCDSLHSSIPCILLRVQPK